MKNNTLDTDNIIKERLQEALFTNMENGDQGIQIQVEKGYVSLVGIVDVLSEKEFAQKIALSIEGVKGVDNSLSVCTDGNIDDDDISQEISKLLSAKKSLADCRLSAESHDGTVRLLGEARTLEEANLAVELAGSVIGVKEIINNIEILPGRPAGAAAGLPADDAFLVNAVEIVFAASRSVEAEDIKTLCRQGVIYLEGEVDTPRQANEATRLAGTVPGVKKVVNNLSIRSKDEGPFLH